MLYASVFLDSLATNGVVSRTTNHHLYRIYEVSVNLYSQYQTNAHTNRLYQSVADNSIEGTYKMAD